MDEIIPWILPGMKDQATFKPSDVSAYLFVTSMQTPRWLQFVATWKREAYFAASSKKNLFQKYTGMNLSWP